MVSTTTSIYLQYGQSDYDIDINVIKNLIGNYEELDTAIDYYLDSEITDDDY